MDDNIQGGEQSIEHFFRGNSPEEEDVLNNDTAPSPGPRIQFEHDSSFTNTQRSIKERLGHNFLMINSTRKIQSRPDHQSSVHSQQVTGRVILFIFSNFIIAIISIQLKGPSPSKLRITATGTQIRKPANERHQQRAAVLAQHGAPSGHPTSFPFPNQEYRALLCPQALRKQ